MEKNPQRSYDERAGLISRTYKLNKQLVDDFKSACEKQGEKQATVLMRLMREYVNDTQCLRL